METRSSLHLDLAAIAEIADELLRRSGIAEGQPIEDGILYFEVDFLRVMAKGVATSDLGAAERCIEQVRDKIPFIQVYARNIGSSAEIAAALARIGELATSGIGLEETPEGSIPTP